MAFLQPQNPSDNPEDFTSNFWTAKFGPFGVSGFNMDGTEVGTCCHLCESRHNQVTQAMTHFEGKKHAQKVKQLRQAKTKFIVEPSTGGDMDDPDNLFLPDRCKVCDAELSTPEQQEGHYMSEKHQKKVRNYFLIKIGIREQNSKIEEEVDEEELKKKSKSEYCALCKIEFSAPVVAQSHYAGKKHAKKLREQIYIVEAGKDNGEHSHRCDICDVTLNSDTQLTQHLQSAKHLQKLPSTGEDAIEKTRSNLGKRKEEIEILLQEEDAKRACLAHELKEIEKVEQMHS